MIPLRAAAGVYRYFAWVPVISPIRLSELSGKITEAIRQTFADRTFWVIADITNHTHKAASNYHYFELVEKDPDSNQLVARMAGTAFGKGAASLLHFESITGQRFTSNINVLINVSVVHHERFGLQLNVNEIDPHFTIGLLAQQRQATLDRLLSENPDFIQKSGDHYLTRNNRLALAPVIQRIAVLSSRQSAGAEDFKHTLLHNLFRYTFFIDEYFTAVQGDQYAEAFLKQLLAIFYDKKPYDAVVIIRGGGAQTDFLIFDNYTIGRAVAKFPIPVITGIGHQKNETITDLMAHTQTKTPTQAAEFIIARNRAFDDLVLVLQQQIIIRSQRLFTGTFQALSSIQSTVVNRSRNLLSQHTESLVRINRVTINQSRLLIFAELRAVNALSAQLLSKPRTLVYNLRADLQHTISNLKTFNAQYQKNQAGYLGHYLKVFRLMSPANLLKKGFAIVRLKGKIIPDAGEVKIGSDVEIFLGGRKLDVRVNNKTIYDERDFNV